MCNSVFRWIILLFCFGSLIHINCTDAVIIPETYCKGITDGTFLPNYNSCRDYIVCINGTGHWGKCPYPYLFNVDEQICDFEENTECFNCPDNTLKFFKFPKTCNKYLLCYDGEPVIQECVDGLQFNARTERCDFPGNVDCFESECSQQNNPRQIQYIASEVACDGYI